MSAHILVADDEKELADMLELYLTNDGHTVHKAYTAAEALDCAASTDLDLAVLDVMFPDGSGFQICKKIREKHCYPIIMLTAKSAASDKILGLTIGADDYITKPFNILEVKARIKAIMRRSGKQEQEKKKVQVLESGELKLYLEGRRVYIGTREINLTAKEFDLLELLIHNPNKVYSREKLLNDVWGYEYLGDVRTVDVHVRRLREKIESTPSDPKYIHTKWGVGYYFQA